MMSVAAIHNRDPTRMKGSIRPFFEHLPSASRLTRPARKSPCFVLRAPLPEVGVTVSSRGRGAALMNCELRLSDNRECLARDVVAFLSSHPFRWHPICFPARLPLERS